MNTPDDLTAVMKQLHEPTPPPSLQATVLARVAREADRQSETAADAPASAPRQPNRPVWLWTLAGFVIVLGASVYGWVEAGSLPDVTSPRIGGSLALIPMEGPTALAIGLGLLIYMAGLVAPLRTGGRT